MNNTWSASNVYETNPFRMNVGSNITFDVSLQTARVYNVGSDHRPVYQVDPLYSNIRSQTDPCLSRHMSPSNQLLNSILTQQNQISNVDKIVNVLRSFTLSNDGKNVQDLTHIEQFSGIGASEIINITTPRAIKNATMFS